MSGEQFKVGDWVRVIDINDYAGAMDIGKTLVRVDECMGQGIMSHTGGFHYYSNIRNLTEEEAEKNTNL